MFLLRDDWYFNIESSVQQDKGQQHRVPEPCVFVCVVQSQCTAGHEADLELFTGAMCDIGEGHDVGA